ncbi:MAG: protoporphyrinogen oxidase [Planctomycetaceae bacterium]
MGGLRCLVIGGGASGLSAALSLQAAAGGASQAGRRIELELLESSGRLGGAIDTVRQGDYLVERGPDMFITDKPAVVQLCRMLGLEGEIIRTDPGFGGSLVLRNGRPVRVPEGFGLLGTPRIGPVLGSSIFSWPGKLRMAMEPLVRRRAGAEDESVASFVRRRLGHEALDRLVQPLVGGIYTGDPERLSLAATLPRFVEMEREFGSLWRGLRASASVGHESTGGARYGLFASLRGGLGQLVVAAERRLESACRIRLNTVVQSIERTSPLGEFVVGLVGGESIRADALILAVPAPVASRLCVALSSDLSERLGRIETASSVVVCTGHRLEAIDHPLDAYGLVVPRVESRRVLAVSFASRKFPGRVPDGRVLLRTFVGGVLQPELVELGDDELSELVAEELKSLLGVGGVPDFVEVVRHRRMMPQYTLGHLDRVEEIERRVSEIPGLALAGSFLRGVGLPDCLASGSAAAASVLEATEVAGP